MLLLSETDKNCHAYSSLLLKTNWTCKKIVWSRVWSLCLKITTFTAKLFCRNPLATRSRKMTLSEGPSWWKPSESILKIFPYHAICSVLVFFDAPMSFFLDRQWLGITMYTRAKRKHMHRMQQTTFPRYSSIAIVKGSLFTFLSKNMMVTLGRNEWEESERKLSLPGCLNMLAQMVL